jgi:uncharacterized protein
MHGIKVKEVIQGFGHENVQATHHATIEFTKDNDLSLTGDCILVVSIDRSLADLSEEFKSALKRPKSKLTILVEADGISDEIHALGSPLLVFTHQMEIVLRKSDFVSDRTLAVRADKAAKDLSRELVEKLKNPRQRAKITLTVKV